MIPWTYSEGSLVEQPAIQLFSEMGWQTVSALEESFSFGGMIDNETKGQRGWVKLLILLSRRVQSGQVKINSMDAIV